MKKHKEITLPELVGEYANLEFSEHLYIDNDIVLNDKPTYRYFLSIDWLDQKKYATFVDITPEALEEVKFDIQKMEVDKMIDKFIEKLESL